MNNESQEVSRLKSQVTEWGGKRLQTPNEGIEQVHFSSTMPTHAE
jgi:hypothetical protein